MMRRARFFQPNKSIQEVNFCCWLVCLFFVSDFKKGWLASKTKLLKMGTSIIWCSMQDWFGQIKASKKLIIFVLFWVGFFLYHILIKDDWQAKQSSKRWDQKITFSTQLSLLTGQKLRLVIYFHFHFSFQFETNNLMIRKTIVWH